MNRDRLVLGVVVSSYLLALAASYLHLAGVFAQLEAPGQQWVGYVAALAIDGALASLALAVHARARAGYGTTSLWLGVVVFAMVSAWANAVHTLQVLVGTVTLEAVMQLDAVSWANVLLLSASLPLVVVYLAHVVDRLAQQQADRRVTRPAARRQAAELAPVTEPPAGLVAEAIQGTDPDRAAALAALLAFVAANPDASLGAAAEAIGRHRNTVSGYASTLEGAGLLARDNGRWQVSADVLARLDRSSGG